jgi:single-stranded DNA-binding protein
MAAPEPLDQLYMDECVVAGTVGQFGVRSSLQDQGTLRTGFSVQVREQGVEGRVFQQFIDVVCWGKAAEAASVLEPGQPVVIEGKLCRVKKPASKGVPEFWYTGVQATRVQVLESVELAADAT